MSSSTAFKPRTFNGDLAHLPHALLPLTRMPHWVLWRWRSRASKNGQVKWTKPPYQIADPSRLAKSNEPSTWGRYEDAVAAVLDGKADGIGFMLKNSHILAGDLDHVRDLATGEIVQWADQLITEAAGVGGVYIEITVSGTGIRFIGLSDNAEEIHRKYTVDPSTGEAIELYRNCTRYITISGLITGPSPCEVLDVNDGFFGRVQARYEGTPVSTDFDFNNAGPQIDYTDIIENGAPEGERSEKFQQVVWHLAGQGQSAEDIAEELARHPTGIGEKYAGRLQIEVKRSYKKWQSSQRGSATGAAAAAGTSSWPQIRIVAGEIPRIVNEAEDALLLLGREIYQRGGMVVRPVLTDLKAADDRDTKGWRLIPVSSAHLVDAFTCAARFLKHDKRSKGWIPVDAPNKVADIYLARQGRWKLPVLTEVTNTPFLRADGSICDQAGYDTASGLLFKPDKQTFPPISQSPTKADAAAALELLKTLIEGFPFVGEVDRAVALSGILTTLDRRAMATAPLHAFSAPSAGTGKSLLIDLFAILATGRPMSVIAQGRNEEELEKRLGAALLAGDAAISLDNCDHPLTSAFLCQALTQGQLNIRLLGYSQNIETPMNATIFANGNNLVIVGDLVRRTLMSTMDAQCEQPELRTFNVNVIELARAKRGQMVIAALTILYAWRLLRESEPGGQLRPLGGFERWSQRVREALVWLGCADPCESIAKVRSNDPEREALQAVVLQWQQYLILNGKYAIQDVIGRAVNDASFHTALLNVAADRNGGLVSNMRLGRWLKQVQGKMINGLRLLQDGNDRGYPLWKLTDR